MTGKRIRVVQWGLGAMGTRIADLVASRPALELVGVIDTSPQKTGAEVRCWAKAAPIGLTINGDADALLRTARPDFVILATASTAREVAPQILASVRSGCNVITIAEEMAFLRAQNPGLADEIHEFARQAGVTVLGTGVNPGFILDTLVVALTGVCTRVERVRAERVNDLSPFGPTVLRTQGVGITPAEFERGLREGSIVGHIGFPESIAMIAGRLGWRIDEVWQERLPIIATERRETTHVVVEPGQVAGCRHTARAVMDGRVVIELVHPQQVRPDAEGISTGDSLTIEGDPGINLTVRPEIPGGTATAALAVNMIPAVLFAPAGLVHMSELPVPSLCPTDLLI